MGKLFLTAVGAAALAVATAQPAEAAATVGNVNINGFVVGNTTNIKDATALDFTDGVTTGSADGVLSAYVGNINGIPIVCSSSPCGSIKDIASLVVGVQSIPTFFLLTGAGAGISFDLTGITDIDRSQSGKLAFDATGWLNAPGTSPTLGILSFTTQGGGMVQTTFSASTTAVPEPGTWALMLIGFAGVGFAMRRHRKPALAQVA